MRLMMLLTLFTNDPRLARQADEATIDRIGLDLERIGKHQRQKALKTWISDHEISDLPLIKEQLRGAKLIVRTNPIHAGLKGEIDRLVELGAQVLMLPYFHSEAEAAQFIEFVDGRAQVCLLVETAASAMRLAKILGLEGVHDIHIGLNDLHLSLGLSSHFELLQTSFMRHLTERLQESGRLFGFGGIARLGDGSLPVPADLIYAQYAYHGAHAALISRVFTASQNDPVNMQNEVANARRRIEYWFTRTPQELSQAHKKLSDLVDRRFRSGRTKQTAA
jgi:hypothetical protein